jgi:hypothetical protein
MYGMVHQNENPEPVSPQTLILDPQSTIKVVVERRIKQYQHSPKAPPREKWMDTDIIPTTIMHICIHNLRRIM